jgi:hypothetical protein
MRQLIVALLVGVFVTASAMADKTTETKTTTKTQMEKNSDTARHDEGKTGFTDGSSAPAGTNVVTGQEAPQQGAISGGKAMERKAKRKHHHADEHSMDSKAK